MPIKHQLIAAVGRASEGQTVAWIGPSQVLVRKDFISIADVIEDGATVRRTNGQESIWFPNGGRIWFKSVRSSGSRGFACDRIYVPERISGDDLMNLTPCVMTSKDGAVIYY
ncbi:hypothetical protein SEA_BAUER_2 [Arthrobacter phage Bauer]|uniref:Uncharacterized protein n=1 Tax=Arthrobacter phage Bauer TaxID=2985648 RepID=A0A9E7V2G8_9CAUD|nr:hypothetical protein QEO99_gp02 [Arthrobacter phage Bauer]UYM26551.1 hypothetical protein SEA_BAUER_2 [Arthrobacter phage Bauer]